MVGFLKQGWSAIERFMKGKSEIWISLHNVCSMSVQELSDCLVLPDLIGFWVFVKWLV